MDKLPFQVLLGRDAPDFNTLVLATLHGVAAAEEEEAANPGTSGQQDGATGHPPMGR